MGRQPDEVAGNALQLSQNNANVLGTRWDFDAQQLFHRKDIGQIVVHTGQIVQAVGVGDELFVAFVFPCLLEAGVQVTEVWVDADDPLAVQFHSQAKDAVGRRMLGAHIDDQVRLRINTLW